MTVYTVVGPATGETLKTYTTISDFDEPGAEVRGAGTSPDSVSPRSTELTTSCAVTGGGARAIILPSLKSNRS